MKLLVYSHDAYGLGNICRMLAICHHLLDAIPNLSILVVSGSPMLHSFRLPAGLDYLKLPCLHRDENGDMSAKYLKLDMKQTVKLRCNLIRIAALNFRPDVVLVDKKPYGLQNELKKTIETLSVVAPETKWFLLLRDILDAPKQTIAEWHLLDSYRAIEQFYDRVLVVGTPEVFDTCAEYQFSAEMLSKSLFCGYIRRQQAIKHSELLRQELKLAPGERCVLVTAGGGEDGYPLIHAYLEGLTGLPADYLLKSLVVCGPEMSQAERERLFQMAKQYPQVIISEFTDDLMSYIEVADTVVAMGGYNTFCEILTAQKPSIIVPRVRPTEEQVIRARKMAELGLLEMIHPDELTPTILIDKLLHQLANPSYYTSNIQQVDLNALPRIADSILTAISRKSVRGELRQFPGQRIECLLA
ncbi:glycosyltransferase family protein [Chamaesiphon sp.]|uniref:glycosyltransferase family protein n=1 Tax=Chamaesiphon sp. TaxID=2814140 RepID=UPI003593189F